MQRSGSRKRPKEQEDLCDDSSDSSDDLANIDDKEIDQYLLNTFDDTSRNAVDDFFGFGFGYNDAKLAKARDLEFFSMAATDTPFEPLEDPEVHNPNPNTPEDSDSDTLKDSDSDASGETVATEIVAVPVSPAKRAKVVRRGAPRLRAVPALKREGRIQSSQDKKSKGSYRPPENRNSVRTSIDSDEEKPRKRRGMVDYIREALQKRASQNVKDENIKMEDGEVDIKTEDSPDIKMEDIPDIKMEDSPDIKTEEGEAEN